MPSLTINKNDIFRDEMVWNGIRVVRFENSVVRQIDKIWLKAQRKMRTILGDLYEPMEILNPDMIINWTNLLGLSLSEAIDEIETLLSEQMSGLVLEQAKTLKSKFNRILGKDIIVESQTMREIFADPSLVDEILNAPSHFDGLRWTERFDYLDIETKKRLRGTISRSIGAGEGIQKARKGIQDTIGLTREKSEVIARTEIARVNNEIQRRIYDENKDILEGIQYLAVLDGRTCLVCGADDGNIYYYGRKKPSVDSAPTIPRHARCRCSYIPIAELPKEIEATAVPERLVYRQWFDKQGADVKKDILGVKRYKLYKMGRFTPDKFVNDGRILALKELDVVDFASGELSQKEISSLLADLEVAKRLDDKKMVSRIKRWLKSGGYELKKGVA